jgi:hypothetical protein
MRPFLVAEKLLDAANQEVAAREWRVLGRSLGALWKTKKIPVTNPTLGFIFKTGQFAWPDQARFSRQKLQPTRKASAADGRDLTEAAVKQAGWKTPRARAHGPRVIHAKTAGICQPLPAGNRDVFMLSRPCM